MEPGKPEHLLDLYRHAVRDQDPEAFLALYHPEARVFDTWNTWAFEGSAARRPAIEGWLGSLGEERVEVTFEDVQVVADATLALLTATGRYAAISPQGEELRAMQNRFTWGLRRDADGGGAWRIVHEHTSTPLGGDLKGILQREAAR